MNCHHSRWSLHWNLLPAATVDGRMVTVLFGSSQLALKIMSIANPSCQTGFDLQTECIENMWKLLTFSYSPDSPRPFPPIQIQNLSTLDHLNLVWSWPYAADLFWGDGGTEELPTAKAVKPIGPWVGLEAKVQMLLFANKNPNSHEFTLKFTMEWLALCQVLRGNRQKKDESFETVPKCRLAKLLKWQTGTPLLRHQSKEVLQ